MLTRDNGEVESESEEMPSLVDCSDEEIAYPVEREALVIRRVLNMQIKEDDIDQQRENIFHTRCHIPSKVRFGFWRKKRNSPGSRQQS